MSIVQVLLAGFGAGAAPTYATLDPSNKGASCTLSGGNLSASFSGVSSVKSTISKTSGKWYWEVTATSTTGNMVIGVAGTSASVSQYTGQNTDSWGYYGVNKVLNNGTLTNTQPGYSNADVIGVALDATAKTVQFYKNGVAVGTAVTGLPTTIFASVGAGGSSTSMTVNFGATAFVYGAPSGYTPGLY